MAVKKKAAKKKVVKKKVVKKKPSQQLAKAQPSNLPLLPIDATPTEAVMHSLMIQMEKGLAPEQLKMVLDAQERVLDRQAEQDYSIAMKKVQAEMPCIAPNKQNDHTNSDYANLKQINKVAKPIYTGNGFSLTFSGEDSPYTSMLNGELGPHVRVLCDIRHNGGWHEKKYVDIPIVTTGAQGGNVMTKTHATTSALTYGQTKLIKMLFNISVADDPDDDDGNLAGGSAPELSDDQLADMNTLIDDAKVDMKAFLKFAKSKTVEGIKLKDYDRCIQMLQRKINTAGGVIEL